MGLFNRRYQLNFQWSVAIVALFTCISLMSLTVWQINRGLAKQAILEQFVANQKKPFKAWTSFEKMPQMFENITIMGENINKVFLLDNQYMNHKLGYQVLTPLRLANNALVLIDRGWIKANPKRHVLPSIMITNNKVFVKGSVYYPSKKAWILGSMVEYKQKNITVIEKIDTAWLSKNLHQPFYPFIIRLSPLETQGFKRQWNPIAMTPSRHYAYALQWFCLMIVAVILFTRLSIKKNK